MKIIQLTAENIKKLSVVEIKPNGHMVEITGRNDSGKTSVLDAIWWALAGADHIQSLPIRRGAKTARVRLDLGELVVTRSFTDKGSYLQVENVEGARYPSPQTMLDGLIGELSFDPLEFLRLKPAEQFRRIEGIADLGDKSADVTAANRTDYEERRDHNRDASTFRTQADGVVVPEGAPDEMVDVSSLDARLQEAAAVNMQIQDHGQAIGAAAREIARLENLERQYKEQLAVYAGELAAHRSTLEGLNAKTLPEAIDAERVQADLGQAHETNEAVRRKQDRARLVAQAQGCEKKSTALTERMAARTLEWETTVAAAKMPVEGLSLSVEGGVVFNDVPFDQISSSEQLRISTAIAMAANPKIRVLRISEGSLLDEDGLRTLAEMAEANDYQIWIERVDTSGKIGVVMEDGHVKGAPPPEPDTPEEATPADQERSLDDEVATV